MDRLSIKVKIDAVADVDPHGPGLAAENNEEQSNSDNNRGHLGTSETGSVLVEIERPDRGNVVSESPSEIIGGSSEANAIEQKIQEVFGQEEDGKIALAVATAESHLNPLAQHTNSNGTIDRGLFQINSIHTVLFKRNGISTDGLFDIERNIMIAKQIRDASGWNAWVTYKTGAYKKYL